MEIGKTKRRGKGVFIFGGLGGRPQRSSRLPSQPAHHLHATSTSTSRPHDVTFSANPKDKRGAFPQLAGKCQRRIQGVLTEFNNGRVYRDLS